MADLVYTRVHEDWHDEPATDTPITAEALGRIEDGIVAVTEQANTLLATLQDQINSLKMTFRGDWNAQAFTPGDVVRYNGSAYVCTSPVHLGDTAMIGSVDHVYDTGYDSAQVVNYAPGTQSGDLIVAVFFSLSGIAGLNLMTQALGGRSVNSNMWFVVRTLTAGSETSFTVPAESKAYGVRLMTFRNAVTGAHGFDWSSTTDAGTYVPETKGLVIRICAATLKSSGGTIAASGGGESVQQSFPFNGGAQVVSMASTVYATNANEQLVTPFSWAVSNQDPDAEDQFTATLLIENNSAAFPASAFAAL